RPRRRAQPGAGAHHPARDPGSGAHPPAAGDRRHRDAPVDGHGHPPHPPRGPVPSAPEIPQLMAPPPPPTRAEASDVATAVFDGTDAVMLSQETATGNHPALVARMMARIVTEAEQSAFYRPLSSEQPGQRANIAEAVARNACDIARDIGARVLVAFSESGVTARYASKARPNVPIIAFSPNATTRRRLALFWCVIPCPFD